MKEGAHKNDNIAFPVLLKIPCKGNIKCFRSSISILLLEIHKDS